MRGLAIWPVAIGVGVWAESVAFSWDDPMRWLPDLVVGMTFIACGQLAWERRGRRGAGVLLAATGFTWFLGNLGGAALYLHRGPLVHLLVTYPSWRARSRLGLAAVAAGYAVAPAAPVWPGEGATIAFALAVAAVAAREYAASAGRTRRDRLTALHAAAAFGVALAGGAAVRLALPSGEASDPVLLAYQAALLMVALVLLVKLREPEPSAVADLVVELGEARPATVRAALARALGDPSLQVGYWSAETDAYFDEDGRELALPDAEDERSATLVGREGLPFAVLLHDPAVLRDPALVGAVAAATRLSESNVALRTEVQAQMRELMASRRRVLVASDDERRRLELRLRGGPLRRLAALADLLGRVTPSPRGEAVEHVERAREQLTRTREELRELARGLHPPELVEVGLNGALASLAERAPLPVALEVRVGRLPAELEATAYFLCAEALANVAKHAGARRATIELAERGGSLVVVIADDGAGRADRSRGSGLQGLGDRVAALGGALRIESWPGRGTRLTAEIPLPAAERGSAESLPRKNRG